MPSQTYDEAMKGLMGTFTEDKEPLVPKPNLESLSPMEVIQFLNGESASFNQMKVLHRALSQLGWHRDQEAPEPIPEHLQKYFNGKTASYPWWESHTGERIRGMKPLMKRILEGVGSEPSEEALRLMRALAKHPALREEVRVLLNRYPVSPTPKEP